MFTYKKIFTCLSPKALLFVLLLSNNLLIAQKTKLTIEGKVVDSQSGEPIELVNVYLSETTLGAATDKNGNFKIPDVPPSLFTLVSSAIGYEPSMVSLDLRTGTSKFINIRMTPKTYEIEEVDVKAKQDPNWRKQLEIFKEKFFGQNDFARSCEIVNPYHINFVETSEKLTAETNIPIKVRNNALGYEIECVLNYFEYDKIKRSTRFEVLPKFYELKTSARDSTKIFLENREIAYLGSTMHLLSSLAKGRFNYRDEGFILKLGAKTIGRAEEIVSHDSTSNRYYLKFDGCINIQFWNNILRISSNSKICLKFGSTEFSPDGYLIYPNQFEITGAMANEGIATQLPRFFKMTNEDY